MGGKKNGAAAMRQGSAAASSIPYNYLDIQLANVPFVKEADLSKAVPKFHEILGRTVVESVNMNDLDQLQMDLELLLSTCVVRGRVLAAHYEPKQAPKLGTPKNPGRGTPKKRSHKMLAEAATASKDAHGLADVAPTGDNSRPVKRQFALMSSSSSTATTTESGRREVPKNETADRFWATVDSFCSPVDHSHLKFLDTLIAECSQPIDFQIPDIGEYYAKEWTDAGLSAECELGSVNGNLKPDQIRNLCAILMKRTEANPNHANLASTLPNPITQRLLSALMEERVVTDFPKLEHNSAGTGTGLGPNVGATLPPGPHLSDIINNYNNNGRVSGPNYLATLCMERRLRQTLQEQGLLAPRSNAAAGDGNKASAQRVNDEDELLREIHRCQRELQAVNRYTVGELKQLRAIVHKDLRRQEVFKQLSQIDEKIVEIYGKVMEARNLKHPPLIKDGGGVGPIRTDGADTSAATTPSVGAGSAPALLLPDGVSPAQHLANLEQQAMDLVRQQSELELRLEQVENEPVKDEDVDTNAVDEKGHSTSDMDVEMKEEK